MGCDDVEKLRVGRRGLATGVAAWEGEMILVPSLPLVNPTLIAWSPGCVRSSCARGPPRCPRRAMCVVQRRSSSARPSSPQRQATVLSGSERSVLDRREPNGAEGDFAAAADPGTKRSLPCWVVDNANQRWEAAAFDSAHGQMSCGGEHHVNHSATRRSLQALSLRGPPYRRLLNGSQPIGSGPRLTLDDRSKSRRRRR